MGRASALRLPPTYDLPTRCRQREDEARADAAPAETLGATATTIAADLAAPDGAAILVSRSQQIGPVTVLVANAAAGPFTDLLDTAARHFDLAMATTAGTFPPPTHAFVPPKPPRGR